VGEEGGWIKSFKAKQIISLKNFCPTYSVLAAKLLHPYLVLGREKTEFAAFWIAANSVSSSSHHVLP